MRNASTLIVLALAILALTAAAWADGPTGAIGQVSNIKAFNRDGQTFITWKDAAEGDADVALRYALYRSDTPITQANLAGAQKIEWDILYNSARLYGLGFCEKSRLDPDKPMVTLEEGGTPLPMWSGVTAVTVTRDGKSFYAVLATDKKGVVQGDIVPGQNATTEAVVEKAAPIKPIRIATAKAPLPQGLPMMLELHASTSAGSDRTYTADSDAYLYFAKPEMGYRDGLQGVFSLSKPTPGELQMRQLPADFPMLRLVTWDAVENPDGAALANTFETWWFGYTCIPQWATTNQPYAYPFTERRLEWILDFAIKHYGVDRNRIYASGGSMGAWGSTSFAFHHPEIFAAVYPNRPRTHQRPVPAFRMAQPKTVPTLDDGKTDYLQRMDSVKFATDHHEDLPFYGWCVGRRDGFATFAEEVEMAKALAANHHGFAFAFNNGDHSSGGSGFGVILKTYPPNLFALNQSYPAFAHSSIDDDPDAALTPADDDKNGGPIHGINLGFHWKDVTDEAGRWSVSLSNDLCKAEMTVDVTPRRCQQFKLKAGDKVKWTTSQGASGTATADTWGLVTIEKVKLSPGQATVLTISK